MYTLILMVIYSAYGIAPVAPMEFNSQAQCEVAAQDISRKLTTFTTKVIYACTKR
jgi:hypothetical protein